MLIYKNCSLYKQSFNIRTLKETLANYFDFFNFFSLGFFRQSNMANDYCLLNGGHKNNGVIHRDVPLVSMILDQQTFEDTPPII